MGKIHELSAVLADQIAAGEVIENPAAVVKELVENSLDAGSHRIDIILEESGLATIQVIDDGSGIAVDDLALAFKRHATSKITGKKDLFRVQTLGFRGEALPSIASVADVIVESKTTAASAGAMIHLRGGEILAQEAAASRQGTQITVRDLFFNTPVRLKYLKSPNTELANITDIVNRLALGHPEVAFSLTHNGRSLLQTVGNGKLQQVLSAIYGVTTARQMIPVGRQDQDFQISGFVSLPKLTRASRNYISLLINGRYVKSHTLLRAVAAGYGSKLMVGRYPLAVLNIELDFQLVDVNVHPTKQEVRISKEEQLAQLIKAAIQASLASENLIPKALDNLPAKKAKVSAEKVGEGNRIYQTSSPSLPSRQQINQLLTGQAVGPQAPKAKSTPVSVKFNQLEIKDQKQLTLPAIQAWDQRFGLQTVSQNNPISSPVVSTQPAKTEEISLELDNDVSNSAEPRFPELRYIGQLHGTYLLAESEAGLYLVDQHAAQERVNYEFYRQEITKVGLAQQKLLLPIVLTYPTSDCLKIEQHKEDLLALGVQLEDFGPNTYIIHQHPAWFKAGQEEDTIREMIDYLLENQHLTLAQFREKTAIMMSCKRAIKANFHLNDQQARALLAQLPDCENPFNCPHGRPVVVSFSNQDLEKMFKRIQDSHESINKRG